LTWLLLFADIVLAELITLTIVRQFRPTTKTVAALQSNARIASECDSGAAVCALQAQQTTSAVCNLPIENGSE
jgi:hypothetical protein